LPVQRSLYLFFHGLTAAREKGSQLEIVLPRVPGHVFRAGTWLAETPIELGSVLRLQGVTPGQTSYYSTKFAVHLPDCALTNKSRASTILLPRPRQILELLLATPLVPLPGGNLAERKDTGAGWKQIASVQVLVYDYTDENEISLDGHYWEPSATGGAISLHVISTSLAREDKEHELATEGTLARLIRGFPGIRFAKQAYPPDWRDTRNPDYNLPTVLPRAFIARGEFIETPQGALAFAQAELEHIATRMARIARLGRLKQEGYPTEYLWRMPDPLGENLTDCIPFGTH